MSRDPDFGALLNPTGRWSTESSYLEAFSPRCGETAIRIQQKLSGFSDSGVRIEIEEEAWRNAEWNRFWTEADGGYQQFRESVIARHKDDWFELGGFEEYHTKTQTATFQPTEHSALKSAALLRLDPRTMDDVLTTFLKLNKNEIETRSKEVARGAEQARKTSAYAGLASDALQYMWLTNPVAAHEYAVDEIRKEKLLLVAEGDFTRGKLVKAFLIDRDTETILYTLTSNQMSRTGAWKWLLLRPGRTYYEDGGRAMFIGCSAQRP